MGRTDDKTYNDDELRLGTGHRSFAAFRESMRDSGMKDDVLAAELWKMLMVGFSRQREINQYAEKQARMLETAIGSDPKALEDQIRQVVAVSIGESRRMLEPAMKNVFFHQLDILQNQEQAQIDLTKNLLRSMNDCYGQFARGMAPYFALREDKPLALWSGGIELSDYADSCGCMPLEKTAIGAALNRLPLHWEWDLQSPLWNLLSQAFVAQKKIADVNVFFRTADANSVLLRQEVPLLLWLHPECHVHWHPIVNLPRGFEEVSPKGLAAGSWRGFDDLTESLQACVDALQRLPNQNQRSLAGIYIMGLRVDTLGMAPYANDGSTNWQTVREYAEKMNIRKRSTPN